MHENYHADSVATLDPALRPTARTPLPAATNFYPIAEQICVACGGTGRHPEPTETLVHCTDCDGQGRRHRRVELREALAALGFAGDFL